MRLDEPGSLLETGTAVSLQTAPALLGTALLRFPSFCLHVSFSAFFATVDVTWAGTAATAAMDVFLCLPWHLACCEHMGQKSPYLLRHKSVSKKKKKNPTKLLNKLHSPGVLPFIKSQGNNSVYNRRPDCFTTSAWTKQNKCVERWPVSEGQNRYLVSYTVAMQPLVSSVTLVSVRSCSDGYSCMHVCTLRRTHFPILASEIVTLSQTSCTLAFAYRLPHIFHFSFFQAQQERLGGSRPCQTRPPSPLAWCWWKY